MREVRVSDATLRRAAKSPNLTLTFKEKLELAKLLDRLGASVIEIEQIKQEKADSLFVKSVASIVKNSVLCVPVKLNDEHIKLTWKALEGAAHARLQVHAAVSPAQMEYMHRKKPAAMLESIIAAVSTCKQYTNDVEVLADDATRADREFLIQVINSSIEAGATTVTVCDAAGTMLPDEFRTFVLSLYEDIPALKDVNLGISCSDALYLADANAIAGIIAGATEIKATSYPMDISSTDKVAKILSDKADTCEVSCSVRTTELKRINTQIAWICQSNNAKNSVLDSASDADESVQLTAQDDIDAVIESVKKLGYDLSPEDQVDVFKAFQRIATKKGTVGSRELDAIVASAALQVPPTYEIDNYVINSGNIMKATARIALKKDDELLEAVGVGDGPIDAAYMAIELVTGRKLELDDFQIQSVTQGQEAMGETIVKLVSDGKVYSGRGISTDIVGSAIRAFVNALNKIVYEEQK